MNRRQSHREPRDNVAASNADAGAHTGTGGDSCRFRKLQLLSTLVSQESRFGAIPSQLARETATLVLAGAVTLQERTAAIDIAMSLGMPLSKIEEHLDWLDANRS